LANPGHISRTDVEKPTAITLISFTARGSADSITLNWQTGTEINNAGFNIYRATSKNGSYTQKINDQLIVAKGDPVSGDSYTYTDTSVAKGIIYYYKLQDVQFDGMVDWHGPVSATASPIRPLYLPLIVK
jgi:hypothetical protein